MKAWGVIGVLAFGFFLYWLYEANPANIFQRGENGR